MGRWGDLASSKCFRDSEFQGLMDTGPMVIGLDAGFFFFKQYIISSKDFKSIISRKNNQRLLKTTKNILNTTIRNINFAYQRNGLK
jgi:hypothetical protein